MNKQETPIDKDSVERLEQLGFEHMTQIGHPYEKLSCGYRCRFAQKDGKSFGGGIHIYPLFESNNDPSLFFDYAGGRIQIRSEEHLLQIMEALTHLNGK